MAAKRPSNPLALAVLTLLYEEPMHPYQMSTTLKERAKEQSIKLNYGSLYAVVESLEKKGYITAHEAVREGRRPERTVYAITDDGKQLLVTWLTELLSTPMKEFPKFEAALSLMPALPPDTVITLLEQRLANQESTYTENRAFMDQAYAAGMPRLFAVEHEYELALLKAEVEFLAGLVGDLRSEHFSGLAGWRRLHELRDQGLSHEEVWAGIREEFEGGFSWVDEVRDLAEE